MVISPYVIPGLTPFYRKDSPEFVVETICDFFHIKVEKLQEGKRASKEAVYAREMCVWFLCRFFDERVCSLTQMGRLFKRHHTTIIYFREKVRKNLYDKSESLHGKYYRDYMKLQKILNPYFNVHDSNIR